MRRIGAGGRGESFDWNQSPKLARWTFLAGGLSSANVAEAIRLGQPYAVDASSGIESSPGHKDGAKMEQFLGEVRRADLERFNAPPG